MSVSGRSEASAQGGLLEGFPMDFHSIATQGGNSQLQRFILAWIEVAFACIFGVTYAVIGKGALLALWLGAFLAACITVRGLNPPADELTPKQGGDLRIKKNG
jgi:hypothetical protein